MNSIGIDMIVINYYVTCHVRYIIQHVQKYNAQMFLTVHRQLLPACKKQEQKVIIESTTHIKTYEELVTKFIENKQ